MQITAVEPQQRRAERVNVYVDGAFRLALAAELVLAEGLRPGVPIDEPRLAALAAADAGWKAREAALRLLAVRPRSVVELQRRLRDRGFAGEVVEGTIERLQAAGLVDDASFAESFVRDRVRFRPHGGRRLRMELRRKGVDPELAGRAVDAVLEEEETSEAELAARAAARWRPRAGEDPAAARRRLYAFLARRGFGADAIRAVVSVRLGSA